MSYWGAPKLEYVLKLCNIWLYLEYSQEGTFRIYIYLFFNVDSAACVLNISYCWSSVLERKKTYKNKLFYHSEFCLLCLHVFTEFTVFTAAPLKPQTFGYAWSNTFSLPGASISPIKFSFFFIAVWHRFICMFLEMCHFKQVVQKMIARPLNRHKPCLRLTEQIKCSARVFLSSEGQNWSNIFLRDLLWNTSVSQFLKLQLWQAN